MLEVRATVRRKKLARTHSWRDMLFHLSTEMSSGRDTKRMGKRGDAHWFWEVLKQHWRKVLYVSLLGFELCFDFLASGSYQFFPLHLLKKGDEGKQENEMRATTLRSFFS